MSIIGKVTIECDPGCLWGAYGYCADIEFRHKRAGRQLLSTKLVAKRSTAIKHAKKVCEDLNLTYKGPSE